MNVQEIMALRDRLKNKLKVVEQFLEIAQEEAASPPVTHAGANRKLNGDLVTGQRDLLSGEPVEVGGDSYGSISNAVEAALIACDQPFSMRDICNELEAQGKFLEPAQISVVLARLKRLGKLTMVTEKSGQIGATYRLSK